MRRAATLAALTAWAGLAGACTVGPNYNRPDIASPAAFAEAVSTQRTAVSGRDGDLTAWWTQFGDAELDSLVKRALAGNPDLQIAASRVRQAREQQKIAFGALFPTLSGSANAVDFNSDRNSSSSSAAGGSQGAASSGGLPIPSHLSLYSVGFDSTWEVDLFGGVRRNVEEAKANAEAQEWARRDTQVTLLAEVANAYMTLRAIQVRIAIGQQELKRQQDLFGLIRDRRENGFTTQLDVNQQTTQVAIAAAQIPQLEGLAAAQVHALGILLGQPPETLTNELITPAPAQLPPPPPTLPAGLPSELLQRRPDLREAERRLAAANANVGVQTANLYPKLNLIGLASLASPKLDDLFSAQNFSTAGVGMLSAPIFNGGRTNAGISSAREQRQQALISYQQAVLGAFRDVEDALARFKTEDDRRTNLDRSVTAAENSLKIAQDQYQAGLVTFINVLQAENTLLNARDQLVQSDAQALSDLVSVYKALGGGWTAPQGQG